MRFRPRFGPTLAALLGIAVLLSLGFWQLQRLEWKRELIALRTAQLQAAPVPLPRDATDWSAFEFRRVSLRGRFRHDLAQFFGLSKYGEQLGHHLLTPLIRPDGSAVLIDRGWVPTEYAISDPGDAPPLEVEVTGIARYRAAEKPGWFTPGNEPAKRIWYWYDLDALRQATGLDLLPVVVEADAAPDRMGPPVGGRTRIELQNNHLQYALTRFGLALVLLVVYIAFSLEPRERT